ncbi:hypothetical protein Tco_0821863 [Tanacetum coccineum]|uniref:Reverse transcriptase domain-containing protein n=1 Tax=Tanacetum coccineum TaxID=301880 RepID=A0ABQ5AF94_9ASTR
MSWKRIYRGKKERVKSIALKAKKESSDDETLTSGSDDEEYVMAVAFDLLRDALSTIIGLSELKVRVIQGSDRVARMSALTRIFHDVKPLYFQGTEGVVELTQWFERMETVFRISNCSVENHVKFSTCTLLASALTWWNSHVMTVTHDVAYSMTWVDLRKKHDRQIFVQVTNMKEA